MGEQALTPKEVAHRMEAELHGEKFNLVNLSHYRAGRSLPRPRYLKALCAAVGVPSDTLLAKPDDGELPAEPSLHKEERWPVMRIDDLADGEAFLQINKRLPWSVVRRILEVLKEVELRTAEAARHGLLTRC